MTTICELQHDSGFFYWKMTLCVHHILGPASAVLFYGPRRFSWVNVILPRFIHFSTNIASSLNAHFLTPPWIFSFAVIFPLSFHIFCFLETYRVDKKCGRQIFLKLPNFKLFFCRNFWQCQLSTPSSASLSPKRKKRAGKLSKITENDKKS